MAKTKSSDIGMALLRTMIPPLYGVIVCFREIYLKLSGRPSEFNEPSSNSSAPKQSQDQSKKPYEERPMASPYYTSHKEPIRNFSGKILAWITTDSNGKQTIQNFTGKILGTYDGKYTRDFYGKILNQGNTLARLIDER